MSEKNKKRQYILLKQKPKKKFYKFEVSREPTTLYFDFDDNDKTPREPKQRVRNSKFDKCECVVIRGHFIVYFD